MLIQEVYLVVYMALEYNQTLCLDSLLRLLTSSVQGSTGLLQLAMHICIIGAHLFIRAV